VIVNVGIIRRHVVACKISRPSKSLRWNAERKKRY